MGASQQPTRSLENVWQAKACPPLLYQQGLEISPTAPCLQPLVSVQSNHCHEESDNMDATFAGALSLTCCDGRCR